MSDVIYTPGDFVGSGGLVDANALKSEIAASPDVPIQIISVTTNDAAITIEFQLDLIPVQKAALDAIVAAHTATPLPVIGDLVRLASPSDPDGHPIVVQALRQGSETTWATHNFADETTWFGKSERVTSQVATDSGDGLTFNLPDTNLINMDHGYVYDEDGHVELQKANNPGDPHGWAVVVRSDGFLMAARHPHAPTGGDYMINHAAGSITFFQSQAGKTVTVSYSRKSTASGSSCFVLKPLPGKRLDVERAEVQFSDPIGYNDTITLQVMGLVDYFAPDLMPAVPSGTLIPLVTTRYKTIDQMIDEAEGSFPVIPAIGGSGSRGNQSPRHGFPFRYGTIRSLSSALQMELRVFLESDRAFTGERATATFYCTSHKE